MSYPVVAGLPAPGRTLVMGVVNVTPDSFSDGGTWFAPEAALEHGLALLAEGADVVDVGGESTRPGAERPGLDEELRRVLPTVEGLVAAGASVSVDTMRSEVASAAVEAGACLVNDVSGGRADPRMLEVVAGLGVAYVCMHWRGHAREMQGRATYDDVVADVARELSEQVKLARTAGVGEDRLVVDAGFGFAKTGDHSWELLDRLDEVAALGLPQLVGVSRKSFLGSLLAGPDGAPRPPRGRDDATVALTALLAQQGVWGVRVHAVRANRDAVEVVRRLSTERADAPATSDKVAVPGEVG
ncbi:dihydropteroate synthase [Microlunatus antarcticus]|uniref:Dihydropteroate synthase n=1 Tax=Microlunatus antarcticus TaxID=53388 RepID=A0A7W5P5D3_9ACTN|nr:dihydropteroate synthase [Microlunatus antarcticus]MBB3325339.1 dihydropteroate synthase [Microlunatus antarcticus]